MRARCRPIPTFPPACDETLSQQAPKGCRRSIPPTAGRRRNRRHRSSCTPPTPPQEPAAIPGTERYPMRSGALREPGVSVLPPTTTPPRLPRRPRPSPELLRAAHTITMIANHIDCPTLHKRASRRPHQPQGMPGRTHRETMGVRRARHSAWRLYRRSPARRNRGGGGITPKGCSQCKVTFRAESSSRRPQG